MCVCVCVYVLQGNFGLIWCRSKMQKDSELATSCILFVGKLNLHAADVDPKALLGEYTGLTIYKHSWWSTNVSTRLVLYRL